MVDAGQGPYLAKNETSEFAPTPETGHGTYFKPALRRDGDPGMEKLVIDLTDCYGIQKLYKDIDLSKGHVAIYASNGTMKSSLAQTFKDEAEGAESRDRIFGRVGKRHISIGGKKIPPDSIMVIESRVSTDGMPESSSGILANEGLQKEHNSVIKELETRRKKLISHLAKSSRLTKDDVEKTVLRDFGKDGVAKLPEILRQYQKNSSHNESMREVKYADVLGDEVWEKLQGISGQLQAYVQNYKRAIEASEYWNEEFDHNSAEKIGKALDKSGFFRSKHAVKFNKDGKDGAEASDYPAVREFLGREKEKIAKLMGPEWREIDDQMAKTGGLTKFRAHVAGDGILLDLVLNRREELRKKLWHGYFENAGQLVADLVEFHDSSENEIQGMTDRANREATRWDHVVGLFNSRFSVPFKVEITDRPRAILDGKTPTLQFKYEKSGETETVAVKDLDAYMSTGEKRAFYILNVLFKIEARIKAGSRTIIVLDDIVDSFDYANKYAIIQYLKDISEHGFFRLIILTHNFDFFRSIANRGIAGRENCYYVNKEAGRITFRPATDVKSPLGSMEQGGRKAENLVAAIPLARNLVECRDGQDGKYDRLTSLLHWKQNTQEIRLGELQGVLDDVMGDALKDAIPENPGRDCGSDGAYDFIAHTARRCSDSSEDSLPVRVALAVAIRLEAERFMYGRLKMRPPGERVRAKTHDLITRCRDENLPESDMDALEKVGIMVPDFVHLNAFMYEPLIDIDGGTLRDLFRTVSGLNSA